MCSNSFTFLLIEISTEIPVNPTILYLDLIMGSYKKEKLYHLIVDLLQSLPLIRLTVSTTLRTKASNLSANGLE